MEKRLIDQIQKAKIHIAIQDLNISDEDYRAILHQQFKVGSCTKLTYLQGQKLLAHFESLGWKPRRGGKCSAPTRRRRPQGDNVVYLANNGEKWKIIFLARDLGWEDENNLSITNISGRLKGFIQKMTQGKKQYLHRLTSPQAGVIIEALKKMIAGGRGERRKRRF